ncbi:suppressor of fused [Biomphalaria glabrata]|uniref:Suppressor of fused homolog n=1 Tax=Biomphalaria glabrata TaxID=6526 RepID=A0A2C9JDF8_BIOGL|nr:suppressor of fused homolog [Biomphalaria glabrata]KAI8768100.1 putative suppressor of fused [Biomphalaria glabrata]
MDDRERVSGVYTPGNIPITPPGLEAIYSACRRLYPDQPNPLQVTALVKYWLGGPDPLDYISMYANPGDPDRNIPPHWHYISFGLSDLHGDCRVYELGVSDGPSGFGFELTFRLKREPGEANPPTWPAALMQALARYVFQSENVLCSGDHVSWHTPLDGSESRIQHMLMTEDAQMQPISSILGVVNFIQIVGVCGEELKAAQHWNGPGIIELLRSKPAAGGAWLVTDMRRGETIFELDPHLKERLDQGIEQEGSNLSGVSAWCSWDEPGENHSSDSEDDKENKKDRYEDELEREEARRSGNESDRRAISHYDQEQIKATLKKGLSSTHLNVKDDSQSQSRKESFDSTVSSEGPTELIRTRSLDSVHLKFNLEAGSLLPLALRGRLKHGRHFTFKGIMNDIAITLVSSSVVGSITDDEHPFAAHGTWLQVLIQEDAIDEMIDDLDELSNPDEILCPKTYSWPEKKLCITILPDES